MTYLVTTNKTLDLDEKIIEVVRTFEHPFITKIMIAVSFIGNTWPVIIVSLVMLFVIYKLYQKRDEVLLFIIVSLGSTGVNQLLKHVFKRERPILDPIVVETGFSYPSGHSMAAFSLYGIITFLFWRHIKSSFKRKMLIVFSVIMIFIIGFSRVYLRVHFPTDVLGAYLISGVWLFFTIWIYQYIKDKQFSRQNKKNFP
ncbi:phosphatase PAP2 family protein [Alkalihalobacillus sp. MEB130]|uniref:phosphatase PAP2 family protein n=1 Tax=Alkalihalobacillus sp. MEB130 TaxID=2976704 RepID=UPI0028DFA87C|nr:phosphatase PAP2 family protein [Alkalihalobacillus sp. MEB130]MDT8861195.1 phosphatase PAP2 family protein [Alkalihalobacillus sp. MEB130]